MSQAGRSLNGGVGEVFVTIKFTRSLSNSNESFRVDSAGNVIAESVNTKFAVNAATFANYDSSFHVDETGSIFGTNLYLTTALIAPTFANSADTFTVSALGALKCASITNPAATFVVGTNGSLKSYGLLSTAQVVAPNFSNTVGSFSVNATGQTIVRELYISSLGGIDVGPAIKDLQDEVGLIGGQVVSLNTQVSSLNTQVTTLTATVSAIQTISIPEVVSMIDNTNNDVIALQEELETVELDYLKQVDADTWYLKIADASETYATISSLSGYLTTSAASATYATISSLSGYLTTAAASATYATISSLSSYLTTTAAASTYLTQTAALNTYLRIIDWNPLYNSLRNASLKGYMIATYHTGTSTWTIDDSWNVFNHEFDIDGGVVGRNYVLFDATSYGGAANCRLLPTIIGKDTNTGVPVFRVLELYRSGNYVSLRWETFNVGASRIRCSFYVSIV